MAPKRVSPISSVSEVIRRPATAGGYSIVHFGSVEARGAPFDSVIGDFAASHQQPRVAVAATPIHTAAGRSVREQHARQRTDDRSDAPIVAAALEVLPPQAAWIVAGSTARIDLREIAAHDHQTSAIRTPER